MASQPGREVGAPLQAGQRAHIVSRRQVGRAERRGEPVADPAFHLRGDVARVDRQTAIDRANDAVDLHLSVGAHGDLGNLRDRESQVSKKAADPKRGYHALHMLNTRPAVTYLSKVIRGKVEG